jgi:hypothetical protein
MSAVSSSNVLSVASAFARPAARAREKQVDARAERRPIRGGGATASPREAEEAETRTGRERARETREARVANAPEGEARLEDIVVRVARALLCRGPGARLPTTRVARSAGVDFVADSRCRDGTLVEKMVVV